MLNISFALSLDSIDCSTFPVHTYILTPQVPPKVEYYMSEMGKGLRPVVKAMYEWIEKYDIV